MRHSATLILIAAAAATLHAQPPQQRRATTVGGSRPGVGRCVVEVVVDGTAEVEIRGDSAVLRNLKGQIPQWRRFECDSIMPANPANFRFRGVDGRGRQDLISGPQGGNPVVVRIDDPDNGSEGYTFEFTWGEGNRNVDRPMVVNPDPIYRQGPPPPQDRPYRDVPPPPPPAPRMLADDAVRLCQDYVRGEASRRFRADDVLFRRTMIDDQPGRNDWVTGFFESRTRGGLRNYRFSCSVNFDNGQVRSADIQPVNGGPQMWGDVGSGRAIQACEASVQQRMSNDGYRRIDFGSVNMDNRSGRNDLVVGAVSAMDGGRPAWFDFNCSVSPRDGAVRTTNVNRR